MLDPIDSLSRVVQSNVTNPGRSAGSVKATSSSSDQVDISSLALDSFRAHDTSVPKEGTESPGAVVFRLENPLSFVLRGDSVTRKQLDGFLKEVSKFHDDILGINNQVVSTPDKPQKPVH